jgi:hypothetical protein
MKKTILLLLVVISLNTNAQSLIGGDNILKTSITSDALKNFNLTYERSLNHFISISASYRTMPKGPIPLKSLAEKFIDNPNINFDNFQIGNNAITLESRFYLGLQKMSGFYIAPYVRSANFDLTVPVTYTYQPAAVMGITPPPVTASAKVEGTIRSQAYGAYVGVQFQLLTKLVLDIWIAGGSYGSSNGKLIAPSDNLPAPAVNALQKVLDQTNAKPFTLKSTVTSTGAVVDTQGPWAGFKGLGLSLGLRF